MEAANMEVQSEPVAASRSRLYQLLALAFAFPDEEFYDAIRDGTFVQALTDACRGLPYDLSSAFAPELQAIDAPYLDFESEYIRLFDVGASGPPCPLYGGVYGGDRMKGMEDAVRFYNFFSLRLSEQMHELPDHITTELEFLHYLTFREAELREHGMDPSSLVRAERDFLERHLCRWVPKLLSRLAKQTTIPFFPALVQFSLTFFQSDHRHAKTEAATFD